MLVLLLGRAPPHRVAARLDLPEAELALELPHQVLDAFEVTKVGQRLPVETDVRPRDMEFLVGLVAPVVDGTPEGVLEAHPFGEPLRDVHLCLAGNVVLHRYSYCTVTDLPVDHRVERSHGLELAGEFPGVTACHVAGDDFAPRLPRALVAARLSKLDVMFLTLRPSDRPGAVRLAEVWFF